MRNPNWTRDELLLALELYLIEGHINPTHDKVIELSNLLNQLPIHTSRPDLETFRNPNGVALKLANFRSIDPNDPATGMSSVGKGDREVWKEFSNDLSRLSAIVTAIKTAVETDMPLPNNREEGEEAAEEGRILYRLHRTRERDRSLIQRKKKQAAKSRVGVRCEVCDFNFEKVYGEHGSGYIECHHKVPLSQTNTTKTKLNDLSLVCANCHRMLHRGKPWPSVEQLKIMISRPQSR